MEKPQVTEIKVRIDCNGCVQKIKKALHGINGINDIYIDVPQQKLTIIGWVDPEKIIKAIKKTRKLAILFSETQPSSPTELPFDPSNPSPIETVPTLEPKEPKNQPLELEPEDVHVIHHHSPDHGHKHEPPLSVRVKHNCNTYKPTPSVTDYKYTHSPPQHAHYIRHETPQQFTQIRELLVDKTDNIDDMRGHMLHCTRPEPPPQQTHYTKPQPPPQQTHYTRPELPQNYTHYNRPEPPPQQTHYAKPEPLQQFTQIRELLVDKTDNIDDMRGQVLHCTRPEPPPQQTHYTKPQSPPPLQQTHYTRPKLPQHYTHYNRQEPPPQQTRYARLEPPQQFTQIRELLVSKTENICDMNGHMSHCTKQEPPPQQTHYIKPQPTPQQTHYPRPELPQNYTQYNEPEPLLQYTQYNRPEPPQPYTKYGPAELSPRDTNYNGEYHSSSNGNGNIISIFSDENPNACTIV